MSEMEWLKVFSTNLKARLKDAGMSQQDLADATGMSKSAISKYVTGKQIPTLRAIVNICYELGCDTDELIDLGERID